MLAALLVAGSARAQLSGADSTASLAFCDGKHTLTAAQQDKLLRFAAVVREELGEADDDVVLVSRSGMNLERFQIRYSHAALAWRDARGWQTRQLYFACDESRSRLFDQGIAGFTMDMDNPALGFVAAVRIPAADAARLRGALLDTPRALQLLAPKYSANAYPFSLAYQNCNQWVMEMLAAGWGELAPGDDLRARAQGWLREAGYAAEPVAVKSRLLMLASAFSPFLHLGDHPAADRDAMLLRVSLPSTVEAFVRQRLPASTRIEFCHDERQVVVHRGWTALPRNCQAMEGDRVVSLN
ncbi:MAG: DUF2145 domain-containing protein [Massilia sp.]